MRHISENRIVSITASSENPNFPVERVLDNHPGRKYRSASPAESIITITAGVIGGCSDIMIAGTNAGLVTVTAIDPNAVEMVSLGQQLIPNSEPILADLSSYSNVAASSRLWEVDLLGLSFGDNSVQRYAYFSIDNSYLDQVFSFYIKMSDAGVPYPSVSTTVGDFCIVMNGNVVVDHGINTVENIGNGVYRVSAYLAATGSGSTFGIIKYTTQSDKGFLVSKFNLTRTDENTLIPYVPAYGAASNIVFNGGVTFEDDTEIANVPVSVSGTVIQRSETGAMWIQLDSVLNIPTELSIVLTGPLGQPLEVGIITSKVAETYGGRNPAYGFTEQPVDYSVVAENSNGSMYYKKRNTVRGYSGISIVMVNTEVFKFLAMVRRLGLIPSAWKITDNTGNEWVVYAKFDGMPTVQYAYRNHSLVTFNLLEVL